MTRPIRHDFHKLNFFNIKLNRQRQKSRLAVGLGSAFSNYFLPLTLEYYCPIKTVFGTSFKTQKQLAEESTLLLRDGFIALAYFFKKFPTPPSKKIHLFVARLFHDYLPKAWRGQVTFYEYATTEYGIHSFAKKKIIMAGLLTVLSKENENSIAQFLSDAKEINLSLFKAPENLTLQTHSTYFKKAAVWHRRLNRMKGVSWTLGFDFFLVRSLTNNKVLDVSFDHFIYDSMIKQFVLSRGGEIVGIRRVATAEIDLQISPYHGFVFTTSTLVRPKKISSQISKYFPLLKQIEKLDEPSEIKPN